MKVFKLYSTVKMLINPNYGPFPEKSALYSSESWSVQGVRSPFLLTYYMKTPTQILLIYSSQFSITSQPYGRILI